MPRAPNFSFKRSYVSFRKGGGGSGRGGLGEGAARGEGASGRGPGEETLQTEKVERCQREGHAQLVELHGTREVGLQRESPRRLTR